MMHSVQKPILQSTHILKKEFANLKPGEKIYCFAETNNFYWVYLPRPWMGITQVKVSKKLLLSIV